MQQLGSFATGLAKTAGEISEKLKTANSRIAHERRTVFSLYAFAGMYANQDMTKM